MAGLSVGSTTNTPYATASTPHGKISQKKLDILKQEAEITKEAIEKYRKIKAKKFNLPENATWEEIRLKEAIDKIIHPEKYPKWA